MKRTNEMMMLNYEHEVNVGDLKAILVAQVWVVGLLKPDPGLEIEYVDTLEITFNGVPINGYENWKKFRDFHKDMGINYDVLLDERFEEAFGERSAFKSRVLEDIADIFMGYFHTGAEDEDHLGI